MQSRRITIKKDFERKAESLMKTKKVFDGTPLIITKELKYTRVSKIPIVAEEELDSLSKFKDLMKLIREREQQD